MIASMVPSWRSVSLDELVGLKTGPFGSALHRSDYVPSTIPVVNPMHIKNGRIKPTIDMCVSDDVASRLSEFRLQVGDVVLARRGEMGRCAVVGKREAGWLCGTGSLVLRASAAVNVRFLQRYMSSPSVVRQLEGDSVGSTMVNLNQGILKSLPLPLPPINEQERIADKLDSLLARVDDCRTRLNRVPAILKRFRQSVLEAATSGALTDEWCAEHKEPWRSVTLGDVATDFSYGSAAKSSPVGTVPVLRMGNIQSGRLEWNDLVFTSDQAEVDKYALRDGDVLFNRTNSPELVGKTAVYRGERPAIYAGYLIRVRCSQDLIPEFLNYSLGSPHGREFCWQVKSDGVSQSNINAKKLAAFPFKLPGVREQTEIVRRVESLFALAGSLEARLAAAHGHVDRLTPALLTKAFRGELVPQHPNDEPAAELLARLRRHPTSGLSGKPKRGANRGPRIEAKAAIPMLTRKDVTPTHLTSILKERGALTAEVLWTASQLEIDEFYEQLKDEEAGGFLRENRGDTPNSPRLLEPSA